ncbi:unnamed protein product [Heligmosomoides polygyrus]|uniref:Peptidase S1 domain-containing protein n=1 Tax=Heligmosomoides polygyrus TaxID=6339 RepID=A0A183F331_HELPZ|nr:unnamed protein product [Heligmosomoides polygyrus]
MAYRLFHSAVISTALTLFSTESFPTSITTPFRKNWKKAYILTGLNSLTDPAHTVHVRRAVIHPQYDEDDITNDIALSDYSLQKPGTSTVCLVKDDSEVLSAANSAMVVGFGLHIVSQTLSALTMGVSDVLQQTKLPIIPLQQCRREWSTLSGGSMTISDKQICAGSELHGTAPGDSGGPLLVKDTLGRLVQVGITSYGAAGFQGLLDQSTYPGVYTRVSPYIPWMEDVTSSATTSSLAVAVAVTLFIY